MACYNHVIFALPPQGDYRVDAKIVDTNTGEEVACYHVELSATQPPCSGFLCSIFG